MIAVLGASGQLGRALVERCAFEEIPFTAFEHSVLDVADAAALREAIAPEQFDCIINCAAYTAVDAAETHPAEAYRVNAHAPLAIARTDVPVLHVSTDYVFSGESDSPYETTDPARPLGVYGASKRAGEVHLLEGGFSGAVVRTAWLYSAREGTRNFLHTVRRLAAERGHLRVVDDQTGTPTLAEDLAEALLALYRRGAHRAPMRILHFTNAGSTTWCGFARAILEASGSSATVDAIRTEDYPLPAARPRRSVLSLESLRPFGIAPRPWREALEAALKIQS